MFQEKLEKKVQERAKYREFFIENGEDPVFDHTEQTAYFSSYLEGVNDVLELLGKKPIEYVLKKY